jgi:hypothetical protein
MDAGRLGLMGAVNCPAPSLTVLRGRNERAAARNEKRGLRRVRQHRTSDAADRAAGCETSSGARVR